MFIIKWFERYPSVLFVLMALTVWGLVAGGALIELNDPFILPCPMCIFQRYLYILIGVLAVMGAIAAKYSKKSIPLFSAIIMIPSAVGVYVAATQSWMQWHPVEGAVCTSGGDDFYSMMEALPLRDWIPILFQGEGDCYAVDWTLLNLSIANWSFIAFCCCVIAMLLMFIKGGKKA